MSKVRTYEVSLNAAKAFDRGGFVTVFDLRNPSPRVVIEAATLDDLAAAIQVFVNETGLPELGDRHADRPGEPRWAVFVRVADGGRKPNGFDAWHSAHKMFAVLEGV